jgi:hypothetical protein
MHSLMSGRAAAGTRVSSGSPANAGDDESDRDRGETRGPSQITRDYITRLARLAVRDIGYEQRCFHWERALIKVYLHGNRLILRRAVSTRQQGRGSAVRAGRR